MQRVRPKKGGSKKAWVVSVPFTTSVCVLVYADTEDEAFEEAVNEASPSVCHQCSKVFGGDFNIDEDKHCELTRDESEDLA